VREERKYRGWLLTKQNGKHSETCAANKRDPWSSIVEDNIFEFDAAGRRRRQGSTGRLWWVVSCNDPDCDAELLVQAAVAMRLILEDR